MVLVVDERENYVNGRLAVRESEHEIWVSKMLVGRVGARIIRYHMADVVLSLVWV